MFARGRIRRRDETYRSAKLIQQIGTARNRANCQRIAGKESCGRKQLLQAPRTGATGATAERRLFPNCTLSCWVPNHTIGEERAMHQRKLVVMEDDDEKRTMSWGEADDGLAYVRETTMDTVTEFA